MPINLLATFSYAIISIFTPGPSNISTASLAVVYGYKRTVNYQFGLSIGFFCVTLLSGLFSISLLNFLPFIESIMRYIGAGYILYLTISILKASYMVSENAPEPLNLKDGIMLQLLNPKLIVFTLTLFSSFLNPLIANTFFLFLASIFFAGLSLCSTSIWALFGTSIQTYLREPRYQILVNLLLFFSLIYIALSLIELV
jgi:cysteine/O-acetylserine efflux protein